MNRVILMTVLLGLYAFLISATFAGTSIADLQKYITSAKWIFAQLF